MTPPSPDSPAASAPAAGPPVWVPLACVATTLVLWASAFVAIRHVAHDFTPGGLALGRLVAATLVLAVVLAVSRSWVRPTPGQWASMAAIGILWYGIYNVALNAGEQRLDAGTAAMLIQLSPILIALLAALFLGERFTWPLAAGMGLAFAGVALISLGDAPGGGRDLVGVALVLVSAVTYSIALILQKPLVAALPAVQVTAVACAVATVACLPFAGSLLSDLADATASSGWWLVYLGVFPTAIAFTTYAYALRHMDATRLGVTTYLVPPITIVMGVLLLGEQPPAVAYAGGLLALVGVAVARRQPRKRPADPVEAVEEAPLPG